MKILCIIPAHNEAESLPALLVEIKRYGYDAVVIDDASTDDTAAVAQCEGVTVLSLNNNLGIGGGVQTGFIYAVRNGFDVAVQLDGDGQHNPYFIEQVVAPIMAGEADCVIGSRYIPQARDSEYYTPFPRRMGMIFSTGILMLFTSLIVHDTTSGFRALNRSAFSFFAENYPVDHPEAEALLLLHQEGFRIKEIPIKMRSRCQGQSLFTFLKAAMYPLRVCVGFFGLALKPSKRRSAK